MARPTNLTPAIEKKIVDALKIGATRRAAYGAANVAESTFMEWMARGKGTHSERPQEPVYAEFAENVEKAEAEAELYHTANVARSGKVFWSASMTWLERRHPEDWARMEKREITGKGGGPIEVTNRPDLSKLTEAELDEYERLCAKARGDADAGGLPSGAGETEG